jgi:hypothetical protein
MVDHCASNIDDFLSGDSASSIHMKETGKQKADLPQ